MDDGLQDVSIIKDLNIICFNSSDLIGNGFLLPAGPLRERLINIKNCHIAVINGKRNIAFEKIKIHIQKYRNLSIKICSKWLKNLEEKNLAFAGIEILKTFSAY